MQLLYLSKQARPDIQLPVSFLTTRVKKPDWACGYLWETFNALLTLKALSLSVLKWYLDASSSVHSDMRVHTGGMITMGKGLIYGNSICQQLNTKSSNDSELVGNSDLLPQIVWTMYFLELQKYSIK